MVLHNRLVENIKVHGLGRVTVKPNEAMMQLGVISRDESATRAQQINAENSIKLITALTQFGIKNEEIKTVTYTVFPHYKVVDHEQVLDGFEVTHIFEITVKDIQNVGAIYDLAFQSGANTARNLLFQVTNPTKYYHEALIKAVKDSVYKAQLIANTLGTAIYPVPVMVIEQEKPLPLYSRAAPFSISETTPIMSQDIEISANIESYFRYQY